jgi:hypothetical protein
MWYGDEATDVVGVREVEGVNETLDPSVSRPILAQKITSKIIF